MGRQRAGLHAAHRSERDPRRQWADRSTRPPARADGDPLRGGARPARARHRRHAARARARRTHDWRLPRSSTSATSRSTTPSTSTRTPPGHPCARCSRRRAPDTAEGAAPVAPQPVLLDETECRDIHRRARRRDRRGCRRGDRPLDAPGERHRSAARDGLRMGEQLHGRRPRRGLPLVRHPARCAPSRLWAKRSSGFSRSCCCSDGRPRCVGRAAPASPFLRAPLRTRHPWRVRSSRRQERRRERASPPDPPPLRRPARRRAGHRPGSAAPRRSRLRHRDRARATGRVAGHRGYVDMVLSWRSRAARRQRGRLRHDHEPDRGRAASAAHCRAERRQPRDTKPDARPPLHDLDQPGRGRAGRIRRRPGRHRRRRSRG